MKSAITKTTNNFQTQANIREFVFAMDETSDLQGDNSGPKPTEVVLAALGACTAITLKMYAKRKGTDLGEVKVEVDMVAEDGKNKIHRKITCSASIPDDVKQRLAHIANVCPVHKMLEGNAEIKTDFSFI